MHHGVLLVDKPPHLTSHDVVSNLRRILKTKEVGHCGTLDPLATGLLVVVVGEGTKLSQYLTDQEKKYSVEVQFGLQTDTLDITGNIIETNDFRPTQEQIQQGIKNLTGSFDWPIPMYSAAKVDGKKLYELAREGKIIKTPKKQMSFANIHLDNVFENKITLTFDLSKGSFVRTWVDFFGIEIGTRATVSQLRRLCSGHFEISKSRKLSDLEQLTDVELKSLILSPSEALKCHSLYINETDERKLRNGLISFDLKSRLIQFVDSESNFSTKILSSEYMKLVAVLDFAPYKGFKIGRVLNY
jgi:tRNA pseudouridine55 synthase